MQRHCPGCLERRCCRWRWRDGVGNGDRLIVFDGFGEAGDSNRGDGAAIGGYGKGRGCSCCCRERLVVGEDNLGPIGVCGSRGEGWWSASNGGVVGNGGAA